MTTDEIKKLIPEKALHIGCVVLSNFTEKEIEALLTAKDYNDYIKPVPDKKSNYKLAMKIINDMFDFPY